MESRTAVDPQSERRCDTAMSIIHLNRITNAVEKLFEGKIDLSDVKNQT